MENDNVYALDGLPLQTIRMEHFQSMIVINMLVAAYRISLINNLSSINWNLMNSYTIICSYNSKFPISFHCIIKFMNHYYRVLPGTTGPEVLGSTQ